MARKKKDSDISKKEFLSPRECGQIAGVFQTTVIYWIKHKGLKAHRSPGGHYKVSKQDLLRFLDAHDIYNVDRTRKDRYKLFILDDEKSTLDVLSRLFDQEYDVILWEKADGALQEIKKLTPDLILLDINLPKRNGFEVFKDLKSDLQTRSLPVIFISGLAGEEIVVKGLRTTAEDYIRKPFLLEEVKLRVGKVIDRIYNVKLEK